MERDTTIIFRKSAHKQMMSGGELSIERNGEWQIKKKVRKICICAKWPSQPRKNIHSIIDIGCSFESDYFPIKIKLMRAHGAIFSINLNFLLDTLLFGVLLCCLLFAARLFLCAFIFVHYFRAFSTAGQKAIYSCFFYTH